MTTGIIALLCLAEKEREKHSSTAFHCASATFQKFKGVDCLAALTSNH